MSEKYTTGPLTVSKVGLTNDGQRPVTSEYGRVALFDIQCDVPKKDRWRADCAVRDANARLYAAAPDMLDALNSAEIACSELCTDQDPANECWVTLGKVRAAIAKANSVPDRHGY